MDTIHISKLALMTRIGVYDWEQQLPQKLLIDITIPVSLDNIHDDISATIDYKQLCDTLRTWAETQSFQLIETAANAIAHHIKETFAVTRVTVAVSKPAALTQAHNVTVTVER